MVESLKELNRICQKPRYKEVGNWMARHIVRDAALPITWLLLHTGITANQVTALSLMVGLGGILLLATPSQTLFLMGTLFLQLWYLLDHVDGQVARYRRMATLTGRFFDFLTHHLIHGVLFFALGWYGFEKTGASGWILWGFLNSVSMFMFNLIHDTKYKTFFGALSNMKLVRILSPSPLEDPRRERGKTSGARRIFSFLHKLTEIHILMNILTLTAILEIGFHPSFDLRILLFSVYGVIVPFTAIAKPTYFILSRKIDREFETSFQVRGEVEK